MDNKTFTFSQFFGIKTTEADRAEILKKSSLFQDLKQKLSEEAKEIKLPEKFYEDLFNVIIDKLDELLAIDIPKDVFIKAWSKHRSIQEYRDLEKHPPEEAALVPLIEHTLTTTHKPGMEITIFRKSLGKLELQIDAEFLINGAILEIQNARIMKIHLSKINGKGSLKLMGIPFLEKENEFELPGIFNLHEGVPIPNPLERKNISIPGD